MTIRSEGQFNTVVYEEEDVYRGTRRRDIVLIAAEDAIRLGVAEGERVVIETGTGKLEVSAVIGAIRPGNLAMYYPEANVLVPRRLDPRSHTPAFKSVAARLRRIAAAVTLAALLLAGARGGYAHDVPIQPSACSFDPIDVTAPVEPALSVAPAGPSDLFRIMYDVAAKTADFDLRTVPPRAVTIGTTSGTLALTPTFQARMWASGDLVSDVGLTLDANGSVASTILHLTTGLAAAGGLVAEGAPVDAGGRFSFVGVSEAGLPNLTGSPLVVRLSGDALPAPDIDQFQPSAGLKRFVGRIRDGQLVGRARLSPPAVQPANFALPALVRASISGVTIASAVFPTGLAPVGRKLVGTGQDGVATLTVRTVRRRPVRYAIDVLLGGAVVPRIAGSMQITVDVGGLLARTAPRVRPNAPGSKARISG